MPGAALLAGVEDRPALPAPPKCDKPQGMDQGQAAVLKDASSIPPGMRVGVDGFNLAMPRGTGVATYGRVLTQALTGMGHPVDVLYGLTISARTPGLMREVIFFDSLDQENRRPRPVFLSTRWLREALGDLRPSTAITIPITGRVLSRPFEARMPAHDRMLNVIDLWGRAERHFKRWGQFLTVRIPNPPAVMHWTYPVPVRLEGARNVYTLHDMVPLRMPYTTLDNKRAYLRLIRGCLRWGDHVCTVSEASRRDIIDLFAVPPGRVTNTYQSAVPTTPAATAGELEAWLHGLFGLQRDGYFLFFGALEPKKNVGRLLEAYLASGVQTPLVMVGGRAWKSETELRLLKASPSSKGVEPVQQVRQFEYMPRDWLTGLIQGARAVVFPSLYEGFGLPVLEAMQLGVPVLTSTESSLPEVAGSAALLVDPYDTAAIADALRRLDADPALRAQMSAEGQVQAGRFSIPEYQARLRTLYAAVLAGPERTPIVPPGPRGG